MASGFFGPTVGRLTCRGGKNPVRSFHTPRSCPLLLRLALLLVFGLCVWKWTTSGDILDANQDCSIGFGKSVSTSTSMVFLVKIRWADISTSVLDFRLHDASRIEKFKTCIYSVT